MIQKLTLKETHVYRGSAYGPGDVEFDLRDPVQRQAARKISLVIGSDAPEAADVTSETRSSKKPSRASKSVTAEATKAAEGDSE